MRTDSTSKIVLVSLGSVYTYVACVDRGQSSPVLLNGKFCIPTSVQYRDDTIVVGVENRMDPSSAFLFRSMIGQNYFSNKSCYRYLIPSGRITNDKQGFAFCPQGKRIISVQSILCDFMKELDLEIRDAIGPYGKMVVALPEEFRNNDMDFKDALCGMEQLNVAFESEPIMIVKAFHSVIPEKHFLVIDIGGTHCSFSVVKGGKKPDVLQSENHPNLSYYALLSSVLDGMGSKENLIIDDPVKLLCYLEEKVKEYIRTGTSFFDLKDCNLNSNTSFSLSDQFFTRYLDDELKELSHVIDHMTGKMDGNEYEILVSGGGASLPFLKAFIPDGQVYEKPEEAVIRGMMVHYGELTQPEVVSSTIPSHGVSTNDQVLFFGNSVVGEQPGMESRHGVANGSTGGPRATTAGSVSPVPASRPYGASSSLTEAAGRQEVLESQSMTISVIDMNLIGEPNSAIQSTDSSTSLPLPPQPECISKYVSPLFVPVVPTIPDLDLPSIPLERSGSSALENFSSLSLDTPQTLEFSNIPEMSVPPSIAVSSVPPSSSSSGMDARAYPTVGVFSARSVSAQSEYPCPLPEIMGRIVPVIPALVDGNGNGVSEIPAPPEPPAIPVVPQVPLMERSPPVLPVIPLSKSVSGFVPVIPDVPQSVEAPSVLPHLGLEPVPSDFDAAPDIPSVPDVPPVPDIPDSTIPKPPEAFALPIQSGSQPTPIIPSIPQPTPIVPSVPQSTPIIPTVPDTPSIPSIPQPTPTTPTSPSVPSIPKPPKVPERPTQPMVPTSSSSHRSQLPSPPKPLSSSRYIPAVSSIPERIKLNRPANRKIRSNFVLMCETNDVLLVKPLEELPVTKEFVYREEKADRSSIDFPIAKYTNGKKKCIGSCYEFIKVKKGTTIAVTIHVDEKGTVLYDMSVDGQQITKLSPLKDITDNDFFSTVCNKHPIIDNSI